MSATPKRSKSRDDSPPAHVLTRRFNSTSPPVTTGGFPPARLALNRNTTPRTIINTDRTTPKSVVLLTNLDLPHVRAEWLPALLAGEHHCEWAVWFRVHHPDQVPPPSSDDEAAALLDQKKTEWAERGYDVATDTDNAFLLRGRHAVLAGEPELIVSRDEHTLIISVPTGPPLRSHGTLVRIYMYALRRAHGPHHGIVLPGDLVYQDRTQHIPQGGVNQGLIRDLGSLINRVVADEPAVRVPSTHECGSCAIAHCPERMASPQCRASPTETPQ